jgi:lipoprotein-releasing system ATP-binding protein
MLIEARQLGHRFGEEPPLFTNIDFSIAPGDMVGVSGPSGSGKTTLLSILAGWVEPSEGSLDRSGVSKLSWVPQNPVGVHQRSALDHLTLALMFQGLPRQHADDIAMEALVRFGLAPAAARRMGTLSGGEAQRLMFARASLMPADLLLVDEPTAQLDPRSASVVADALRQLTDSGRAVVIASHDPRVLDVCPIAIRLGGVR